jgi:hypothetical protein
MTSANDNNGLSRRRIAQTAGRRAHGAEQRITAILFALRTRNLPIIEFPYRALCVFDSGARRRALDHPLFQVRLAKILESGFDRSNG